MHLHVIAHEPPLPAIFGSRIDMFYKIKHLAATGVRIHLHYFDTEPYRMYELEDLTQSITCYPIKSLLRTLPVQYPHSVKARADQRMLEQLLMDDSPILFEGLSSTYFLSHPGFTNRKKIVRLPFIDWEFCYQLAQHEPSYLQKKFLLAESRQLQHFEGTLPYADTLLTASPKATDYYSEKFEDVEYLPIFHAQNQVTSQIGSGAFSLYHGNLSVPDNVQSCLFLIEEVFSHLPEQRLYIAGADPHPDLITAASAYQNVRLYPNPGQQELLDLQRDAHIHVLPTFQATANHVKLITSLFSGRFVLTNPAMVHQTGLESITEVATSPEEFIRMIRGFFHQEFTAMDIAERKGVLLNHFDNARNALRIKELISS
ncbi:hypothetical protein [Pontibacter sp. G13]|uniref:hypothetical protein n=1 Tax=Pontibacter sp. G13 TaxID=3074898 RepID=UPI00288B7872|nr:hypothetical protein [Pontibacter sp. G13]WNJ16934.1 hypothetical protein RJD25_18940 [Pontibacter sp. G13]